MATAAAIQQCPRCGEYTPSKIQADRMSRVEILGTTLTMWFVPLLWLLAPFATLALPILMLFPGLVKHKKRRVCRLCGEKWLAP